ncbi:actin-binding protein IPP [Pelomyxa schiedti]|nr:actin-binding protein IPP [Pelomyxa schiedti]
MQGAEEPLCVGVRATWQWETVKATCACGLVVVGGESSSPSASARRDEGHEPHALLAHSVATVVVCGREADSPKVAHTVGMHLRDRRRLDVCSLNLASLEWNHTDIPLANLPQVQCIPGAFCLTAIGAKLFYYDGFDQLFCIFDTEWSSWLKTESTPQAPFPRSGFTVSAIGNELMLFGGLGKRTPLCCNDTYIFDTGRMIWRNPKPTGSLPPGRHRHAAVVACNSCWIFGGIESSGVITNELFEYQPRDNKWLNPKCHGSAPPPFIPDATTVVGTRLFLLESIAATSAVIWTFDIVSLSWAGKIQVDNTPQPPLSLTNSANLAILLFPAGTIKCFSLDTGDIPFIQVGYRPASIWMYNLLESKIFCDLLLDTNDGVVSAHSAIIGSRCPLLYIALVKRSTCNIKSASVNPHVCTRSCIQTASLRSTNEADMGSKLTCSAAQKLVEAIYTGRFPTSLSYSEFLLLKQFLTEAGAAYILPEISDTFATSCILLNMDPVESDLLKLLHTSQNSDLTLVVEGESFECHRSILAFRCPYFATMLNSGMHEITQTTIELQGYHANTFRLILEFIYTGTFGDKLTAGNITEVLYACNQLMLSEAVDTCASILTHQIDVVNAVHLLQLAIDTDALPLKAATLHFISTHFHQVYRSPEFRSSTPTLQSLITSLCSSSI